MLINFCLVLLKTLDQHLNPYEVILIESNVMLSLCIMNPWTVLAETACNLLTLTFHLNIILKLVTSPRKGSVPITKGSWFILFGEIV